MSKTEKAIFETGFVAGYRGDKIEDISHIPEEKLDIYNIGRAEGESHFEKVVELMEVLSLSLREVHQLAIDDFYEKTKKELTKSDNKEEGEDRSY